MPMPSWEDLATVVQGYIAAHPRKCVIDPRPSRAAVADPETGVMKWAAGLLATVREHWPDAEDASLAVQAVMAWLASRPAARGGQRVPARPPPPDMVLAVAEAATRYPRRGLVQVALAFGCGWGRVPVLPESPGDDWTWTWHWRWETALSEVAELLFYEVRGVVEALGFQRGFAAARQQAIEDTGVLVGRYLQRPYPDTFPPPPPYPTYRRFHAIVYWDPALVDRAAVRLRAHEAADLAGCSLHEHVRCAVWGAGGRPTQPGGPTVKAKGLADGLLGEIYLKGLEATLSYGPVAVWHCERKCAPPPAGPAAVSYAFDADACPRCHVQHTAGRCLSPGGGEVWVTIRLHDRVWRPLHYEERPFRKCVTKSCAAFKTYFDPAAATCPFCGRSGSKRPTRLFVRTGAPIEVDAPPAAELGENAADRHQLPDQESPDPADAYRLAEFRHAVRALPEDLREVAEVLEAGIRPVGICILLGITKDELQARRQRLAQELAPLAAQQDRVPPPKKTGKAAGPAPRWHLVSEHPSAR